jgi:hypothetical protein
MVCGSCIMHDKSAWCPLLSFEAPSSEGETKACDCWEEGRATVSRRQRREGSARVWVWVRDNGVNWK